MSEVAVLWPSPLGEAVPSIRMVSRRSRSLYGLVGEMASHFVPASGNMRPGIGAGRAVVLLTIGPAARPCKGRGWTPGPPPRRRRQAARPRSASPRRRPAGDLDDELRAAVADQAIARIDDREERGLRGVVGQGRVDPSPRLVVAEPPEDPPHGRDDVAGHQLDVEGRRAVPLFDQRTPSAVTDQLAEFTPYLSAPSQIARIGVARHLTQEELAEAAVVDVAANWSVNPNLSAHSSAVIPRLIASVSMASSLR